MIIPVAHVTPLRGVPVIDVADIDALARVAEHYDRSILHEKTERGETFWVADESGQFRYALGAPARSDDAPALDRGRRARAWTADDEIAADAWPAQDEPMQPSPAAENVWTPYVEPDTLVHAVVDWGAQDAPADVSPAPAAAGVAYFAGVEWNTNS